MNQNNVSLGRVTRKRMHEYYKNFVSDPDIFMDMSKYFEYQYTKTLRLDIVCTASQLINIASSLSIFSIMVSIILNMIVYNVFKCRQQEVARPTANICNAILSYFLGSFIFIQRTKRFFDNNIGDVFGGVDCTLGVNYFGLFLRLNMSIFSNYKGLIQEQFINLTNNIRVNYTKLIGVIGVIQALKDLDNN